MAKLLKRDYSNVYKDVQSLVNLGIIKLKKEGSRIKLVSLYNQIAFDFQVRKVYPDFTTSKLWNMTAKKLSGS